MEKQGRNKRMLKPLNNRLVNLYVSTGKSIVKLNTSCLIMSLLIVVFRQC